MPTNRRTFLSLAAIGGGALVSARQSLVASALAQPASGDAARLHADGTLPGQARLYAMRAGQGQNHLIGGQVATVIARAVDTGGLSEAAILTGGHGAVMPVHVHERSQEAFYVLDGEVDFYLDGRHTLMTRGDYAYVPAGIAHGHTMRSWRTQLLTWSIGDGVGAMYPAMGQPFARPVQPENVENAIGQDRLRAAEAAADVRFRDVDLSSGPAHPERVTGELPPGRNEPYFVLKGTGERLVAADQLFSFLQTQKSSDGRFITVLTEGPAGEAIPPHYHEEHTENFFCLEGLMTMWVNGVEVHLYPGDFMQVTPGTVHSYRFDAPYTKMVGWLAPGLFEPFFRLIGDPYAGHVFPLVPPPFRFDRVLAHLGEIDLHVLQKP